MQRIWGLWYNECWEGHGWSEEAVVSMVATLLALLEVLRTKLITYNPPQL